MFELFSSTINAVIIGAITVLLFFGITPPVKNELAVHESGREDVLVRSEESSLAPPAPKEEPADGGTQRKEAAPIELPETSAPTNEPAFEVPEPPEAGFDAPRTEESAEPQKTKSVPYVNISELNQRARLATVNVFCLSKAGGFFEPVSGSGVVIDPRGVVITNAHVAQYFLIKDYPTEDSINCMIRAGSPAKPAYKAELLYMPLSWIEENASSIRIELPKSTGKDDFALLYITEPIPASDTLPEAFPFLPFTENERAFERGDSALLASYPAGFLGGIEISKNLWITTSIAEVVEIFTFSATSSVATDMFEFGGTIGAQEGSSGGGAIALETGALAGIIATRTKGESTGERTLRAISLFHVSESMRAQKGETLREFLEGDLHAKRGAFEREEPYLKEILVAALEKR